MTRQELKSALLAIGFIRPATADSEMRLVDEELESRIDKTMLANGFLVSKNGDNYEMKRV